MIYFYYFFFFSPRTTRKQSVLNPGVTPAPCRHGGDRSTSRTFSDTPQLLGSLLNISSPPLSPPCWVHPRKAEPICHAPAGPRGPGAEGNRFSLPKNFSFVERSCKGRCELDAVPVSSSVPLGSLAPNLLEGRRVVGDSPELGCERDQRAGSHSQGRQIKRLAVV